MDDKILVTGGAGFLGSHLCETLIDSGYGVTCLDNFTSGNKNNIDHLIDKPHFEIIRGDVSNTRSLPSVDKIYHLASRASPDDFTKNPVEIALANTQGTKLLLNHARASNARLVFASTSEVYGDPEVSPQPETYNGNVNIRGIRGCYDESKRFGETLIQAYIRKYGLDARTVRIFNTYGPRMHPDDGRVIPTFIKQGLNGTNLTVYGDGKQTRSFCYVDDLIDGLRNLMNKENPKYDVYNMGKENERTIESLAKLVMDTIDAESGIVYEDLPEDDPQQRKPDISRAREDLGWEPTTSLESGLEKTIEDFEEKIHG